MLTFVSAHMRRTFKQGSATLSLANHVVTHIRSNIRMVISCTLLLLSIRNEAHVAWIDQRFACSQVFQCLHVVVIRQFSHDLDIDLLVLVLYHSTEVIRDDMVLLGTPGNLIAGCQIRTTYSTRTTYVVKVGKCVARGESLGKYRHAGMREGTRTY